jgi:purine-nucleoside phosphorylase
MDNFELAADYLLTRFKRTADVGIICGSGLSGLSKNFTDQLSVKYSEIPGFPKIGVAGHKDELVFGNLGSR